MKKERVKNPYPKSSLRRSYDGTYDGTYDGIYLILISLLSGKK